METMETMETLGTMETRVREFGPFIEIENDMYRFRERVYKPDEELDNGIIALLVVGGNMARDNHHYLAEALSECGYEARTLNTLFENSAYAKVLGKRSRDVRIKDSQNILSMAIDEAHYDRATGEDRDVVTFGHSMGGLSVIGLNLDDRIKHAITYGTPDFSSLWYVPFFDWMMTGMSLLNKLPGVEMLFPMRKMVKLVVDKPTKEYFYNEMPKDPNYGMDECPEFYPVGYTQSIIREDVLGNLGRATIPVTYMYGEHDTITKGTVEKAKRVAEANDNVEVVMIPGGYHIHPCLRAPLAEFVGMLDERFRRSSDTESAEPAAPVARRLGKFEESEIRLFE